MNLDRPLGALSILLIACSIGCGTRASLTPVSRNPVASAQLMAAEIRTDDAPKVGKSQRGDASVLDEEDGKREVHGKKHGGFSGYK